MTMYYNIKAGSSFAFASEGSIALNDASVPVEVLFNENSSCGEAMPLADVTVDYKLPDGTVKSIKFEKGENIMLAHEDLSDSPIA